MYGGYAYLKYGMRLYWSTFTHTLQFTVLSPIKKTITHDGSFTKQKYIESMPAPQCKKNSWREAGGGFLGYTWCTYNSDIIKHGY